MTSVNGTLSTMSVPDLLQWLLNGGKTGVLTVVNASARKRLFFDKGAIVGASSSDPDLAFGQFLLDLGKIDEQTLVKLVVRQRETGVMLGRLLVNEGLLAEAEVLDVLRLKARETLFELMAWREGDFEFVEGSVQDGDNVALVLPIDRILFEGIRKAENRRRIREAFPSGSLVPAIISDEGRSLMADDALAAPMVSLMDSGRSLREIARELRLSVVEVSERLFEYLNGGHIVVGISEDPELPTYYVPEEAEARPVTVADAQPPRASATRRAGRRPDPEHLVRLAENFLRLGQHEDAMATIERARQVAPAAPYVQETAHRIEDAFVPRLWEYFGGGDRTPLLAVGLRDLPVVKPLLTPEETVVAMHVSGALTVKDIVEMSPLSDFKTLRLLKSFADAELIIFRDEMDGDHR